MVVGTSANAALTSASCLVASSISAGERPAHTGSPTNRVRTPRWAGTSWSSPCASHHLRASGPASARVRNATEYELCPTQARAHATRPSTVPSAVSRRLAAVFHGHLSRVRAAALPDLRWVRYSGRHHNTVIHSKRHDNGRVM